MHLLNILLGLILVVCGRTLYWAFVGIAGFVAGFRLAEHFLAGQPSWLQWAAAGLAGLLGAGLAVIAQRVAFSLAGFLAGGYLAGEAGEAFAFTGNAQAALMLAGAIAGAILAAMVMDWAIIVLSSLMGAGLVADGVNLAPPWPLAVFGAVAAAGVIIQGRLAAGRRTAASPPEGKRAP